MGRGCGVAELPVGGVVVTAQTARDAVWSSILGVDRTDDTDAVLAALGIPADTDPKRIAQGIAILDAIETIEAQRNGFTIEWDAGEADVGLPAGYCAMADLAITGGSTMAGAVIALAGVLAAKAEASGA